MSPIALASNPSALLRRHLAIATLVAASTVLALTAYGCGDDDDATTGDTDTDTASGDTGSVLPPGACFTPSQCTADPALVPYWVCTDDNECRCLNDQACPPGILCNRFTGACDPSIQGCRADTDCAAGEFCDTESRQCTSRGKPCTRCGVLASGEPNHALCGGSTDLCLIVDDVTSLAYCGKACLADAECNTADIVGEAASTCVGDACPYQCREGQCRTRRYGCCEDDRDCVTGSRCDTTIRQCVPFCDSDDDCGTGEKCCESQQVCKPENYCDAACECLKPTSGTVICNDRKNLCIPGCSSNSACPNGEICNTTTGECGRGCVNDADCPLAGACISGTCQPGCQATSACGVGEVCNSSSKKCERPSLNYCGACNPFFGNCSAGTICVGIGAGGSNAICAQECDNSGFGCPKGFFCVVVIDAQENPVGNVCAPTEGTGACPGI